MKLYSWNVNGIRAVIKKGAMATFLKKHNPDILCLQETKARKEQVEIDLPDYIEYWHSANRKGYSGTAIFTKKEPISVINGLLSPAMKGLKLSDQAGDSTREGRVITAEFEAFHVVTVYTPNAKDDLSRIPLRHKAWDKAFLKHCRLLEKKKPVIFCGDLNVAHTEDDLARPKPNEGKKGFTKEEREGFGNFLKAGFIDTFRMFTEGNGHYTWWSHWGKSRENNVGWRIDYILVSKRLKSKVKNAKIHADVTGSDHCPVSVEVDV